MSVPGFSVSDLIEAIAWTIDFIIALKAVRGEVKDLRKSLETAKSELNGLEELLKARRNRAQGPLRFRTDALNTLRTDVHEILNDIFSLLNRFDSQGTAKSVMFSTFRQNVRWVVDSRYSGTVKDLLRRLSEYRQSVHTQLLLCIHHFQVSNEHQTEDVPDAAAQEQPAHLISNFEKETGSNSSFYPSPVPVALATTSERLAMSSPMPLAPNARVQSPPWQHAPPSPPPSPKDLPNSARSHTGPEVRDSFAPTQAPPVQTARASALASYSPLNLVHEILQTRGEVKVWFQYEDTRNPDDILSVPHAIKTITILRDTLGNFRGIHSTRFDDAVLEHELPNDEFFLKFYSHPCPVHSRQARDLKEGRLQARNCVTFLREPQDRAAMIPDYYSFSAVEDYRLLQNAVVGGCLVTWSEVRSISTKWSSTPVCENQILQLWEIRGVRKIHFFRNGKDRQYSQHAVSCLRVDKKSLKKAHKEGLKVVFTRSNGSPALSPEELKMEYLLIVFTNPKEIDPFLKEARFP